LSTVYFAENCTRTQFINQILEIHKPELEKAEKIFIKPNIVSYEHYPTTTHPETLDTILEHLPGKEITVGDAPAFDAGRANKIIQKSPLKTTCENHHIKLLNLYAEKMKTTTSPRGYKTKISTLPLTCDYVISIPVLKVHFMVGISGALKNQFGYLSRRDRLLMHCKLKNITKGIAEANWAIHTNLFIVDALETMTGAQECRHGGCKAKLNTMIAGTDPVALDMYGLQLLSKLEPKLKQEKNQALKYIDYAASIGLGNKQFETKKL